MKLLNFFKKKAKRSVNLTEKPLSKSQLEKVVGGKDAWEPHKAPGLDLPEQQ